MKIIILVMSIVCVLIGCAGSCITLEGTYKDYKGGLTWCKDAQTSATLDRDVLKNDDGTKAIIVDESELKKINSALDATVSIKSENLKESELEKYKRLISKIK